jgi:hypothetical protein
LELLNSSNAYNDQSLLTAIYLLDLLRYETNTAAAMKDDFVGKVREKIDQEEGGGLTVTEVDEIMAQRGEVVCEAAGIEVSRAWRFGWRSKMLAQLGRTVVERAFLPLVPFLPTAFLSATLIPLSSRSTSPCRALPAASLRSRPRLGC